MEINQVKFGNYSIGTSQSGAKKNEKKEANDTQQNVGQQQTQSQKFDVEGMFNAMNIAGLQNKAQINKAETKAVNPNDYLSEERINDIEAMMAEFDFGVNEIANTIEAEFPNVFAQDKKLALAAKVFAQE